MGNSRMISYKYWKSFLEMVILSFKYFYDNIFVMISYVYWNWIRYRIGKLNPYKLMISYSVYYAEITEAWWLDIVNLA